MSIVMKAMAARSIAEAKRMRLTPEDEGKAHQDKN
jgi:hypothetical protein